MMTPFCNMSDETRIFDLYALLTVGSLISGQTTNFERQVLGEYSKNPSYQTLSWMTFQ